MYSFTKFSPFLGSVLTESSNQERIRTQPIRGESCQYPVENFSVFLEEKGPRHLHLVAQQTLTAWMKKQEADQKVC